MHLRETIAWTTPSSHPEERRSAVSQLLASSTSRFSLLMGIFLLFYLVHEHPQFQVRDGQLSAQVPLLPISMVTWHTCGWILFSGALWALLSSHPHAPTLTNEKGICRTAITVVALVFAIEVLARLSISGFLGFEQYLNATWILMLTGGGVAFLGFLWLRPPSPLMLSALLFGGGALIRVIWFAFITPTPQHTDHLFVIDLGLQRFMAGETPYAYFDFGTHTNPMPYLPWTFLSYFPPFIAGLDLRMTSFVLSLALLGAFWMVFRALSLSPSVRDQLMLALGVLYILPISISLDEQTEFAPYNLMLVLTFGLIALRQFQLAAVAYGFALGSMTVGLFCAVPLLCFALRTLPWRQVVRLGVIVGGVAGTPILIFLIWDAHAFWWAVSYVPREAWGALDQGLWAAGPWNTIVWHALGGWLRLVQVGFFLLFTVLVWRRLRTVYDLIVLSAGGYLALVLSGPYVGPHLVQVVIFLTVLAEAVGAAESDTTRLDV